MPMIEWNDSYSVKIPSIDAQHKQLMGYLNQLFDAMMEGKGGDVVTPILDSLVSYTREHFALEEGYFARCGYPDAAAHKEEHQKLIAQVADFQVQVHRKEAKVTTDLMDFLKNWLIKHIRGTDMKYSAHLREHGIS
jgi:hemerythrin